MTADRDSRRRRSFCRSSHVAKGSRVWLTKWHPTLRLVPADCENCGKIAFVEPRCYNSQYTAAIVQWQNAALWQRMSWVRNPLAAPKILEQLIVPAVIPCPAYLKLHSRPLRSLNQPLRLESSPELRAGLIQRGNRTSIPQARLRSASSSSTPPSLPRSRSTTPSALCPRPTCLKAGWQRRRSTSASASRLRSASRTSSASATAEDDVAQFVSTLEPVRQAGKLGLLLFQLPPNFKADSQRLADFLAAPALTASGATPIAFEFRHESWFTEEIYSVLRAHNAALCIAESDELATPEVHTSSSYTSFRLRRTELIRRRRWITSPVALPRWLKSAMSTSTSSTRTSPAERLTPFPLSPMSPEQDRVDGDYAPRASRPTPRSSCRAGSSATVTYRPLLGNFLPRVDMLPRCGVAAHRGFSCHR